MNVHSDYIYFMYGLSLLLVAVMLWGGTRRAEERLSWDWMAWAALFLGASNCLDMLALSLEDSPAFQAVRIVMKISSFLLLIEFGRSGLRAQGRWVPGWWIHPLLLTLAGVGGLAGMNGVHAASSYSLALPGALLAGWIVMREAGKMEAGRKWGLSILGFALFINGLSVGLFVPKAPFFPASMLNREVFSAAVALPTLLFRAICMLAAPLGVWMAYWRKDQKDKKDSWLRRWTIPILVVLLLAGGWVVAKWCGQAAETDMRERLLSQANAIARTINVGKVKGLSFTATDLNNLNFQRLTSEMMAYARAMNFGSIYSLAVRDGAIVFGMKNLAKEGLLTLPPGTAYPSPPPELRAVFQTRRAQTAGPFKNQSGLFVSAFAPVLDPRTDHVLLVIGIDTGAELWQEAIARARLTPILFTLTLIMILLAGSGVLRWREDLPADKQWRLRHAEALLTTALGLVLTVAVSYQVHDNETGYRRTRFLQQAEERAESVVKTVNNIHVHALAGLAKFFESNEGVTRDEFRIYSGPLTDIPAVEAWAWCPFVSAQEKDRVEIEARRDGLADFTIFQRDAQGKRTPATGRDAYYPTLYVDAQVGNQPALGYDLGSDPTRWEALKEATRTGQPTITDPISLVFGSTIKKGALVIHPAFFKAVKTPEAGSNRPRPRRLHGFAVAVLRFEPLLNRALAQSAREPQSVYLDLYQLKSGEAPFWLASSSPENASRQGPAEGFPSGWSADLSAAFPLFVFGKTYALVVHAGPAFLAANPSWARGAVILAGLLLTAIMAVFISFLSNRRAVLESQVRARTSELRESEQFNRQVIAGAREGIVVYDRQFNYRLWNPFLETLTSLPASQVLGKNALELFPHLREQKVDALLDRALAGETVKSDDMYFYVPQNGRSGWISTVYGPHFSASGEIIGVIAILRDITERKRTEEALRESEKTAQQLAQENAGMAEIGRIISSTLNIEEVYERFAAEARKLIPFDRIMVGLDNPGGDTATVAYASGMEFEGRRIGDIYPIAHSSHEEIMHTRAGFLLQPETLEELEGRFSGIIPTFQAGLRSILSVPLISRDQVIGVLHLRSKQSKAYTDRDLRLAERIAAQIAGAIANARLFLERKRVEEALRESEERYRTVVEHIQDAFYRADERGTITLISPSAVRMLGYGSLDEIIGRPIESLWGYPEKMGELSRRLREEGAVADYEVVVKKKDGSFIFVSTASVLRKDDTGKVLGVEGLFRDITERKRAEEALRKSEEEAQRLAHENAVLAEIGRIISSSLTIEGVYKIFSEEVKKLLPYDRLAINLINEDGSTLITRYADGYSPPRRKIGDAFPIAGTLTERVMQDRKGLTLDSEDGNDVAAKYPGLLPEMNAGFRSFLSVPLISRDQPIGGLHFRSQTYRPYSEKDLMLAERIGAQIAGAITNAQLFQERKRTEEALRESEQKLMTILQGFSIPAFVIGKDHRVMHWNKALTEMSGIEPGEVIGTSGHWKPFYSEKRPCMVDLLVDELVDATPQWYAGKYTKSKSAEGAYEAIDFFPALGEEGKWLRITAAAIKDSRGNLIGAIETLEDITERKRAEEALRESEERYRTVVEHIQDAFYRADERGTITLISPSAVRMLGYGSLDEIIGRPIESFWGYPEKMGELSRRLRDEGAVADYEVVIKKKDGSFIFVSTASVLRKDDTGKVLGVEGLFRDITERKRAEEALRDSEERWQFALEGSGDGVSDWNAKTNKVYFSRQWKVMLGFEEHEIGDTLNEWTKRIHPEDRERVLGDIGRFLREESPVYLSDHRLRCKDGSYKWILSRGKIVSRTQEGIPLRVIGTHTDITERKQVEEALRLHNEEVGRERRNLELIFDSVQVGLLLVDVEGVVRRANDNFGQLVGRPVEEILGCRPGEALSCANLYLTRQRCGDTPHCQTCPIRALLRRVLQEGLSVWGVEVNKEIARDGERRSLWLNLNGNPLEIDGRRNVLLSVIDITSRKSLELSLAKAKEEAEAASRAKSEFLANMSHEIRTPMNGVIGMSGLLLDTELAPKQRQYAQIVRSSGESLLSLINDILDFSKIEARKLELETIDFDLRTTLEDVAEMLAVRAQEKGLEMVCMVAPEVPAWLRGDPGRLRQIIINLGANAVKFTHRGGVTIQARLAAENGLRATVRFSVTDTGIGIPKDKLSILFTPFTQVDGSTTRKYGGSGLGLAISKQLVELMGGQIGVESEENKGSTFWFTALFEKQPAAQAHRLQPVADLKGLKALVVDDHDANRLLVTRLLTSWGCRFAEAADGKSALVMLVQAARDGDPFQVALLDNLMPGMYGPELGRMIKEDPEIRDTRLIMMTSLAQRGDAARLEQIGFSGYLTKPLRQSHLRECLALVMGQERSPAAKTVTPLVTRHTISEARKRRVRILLAEDNSTNQMVSLEILEKLGYRADAVADGKEAINALQKLSYDLVLMDCEMPKLDGFEATRIIRSWKLGNGGRTATDEGATGKGDAGVQVSTSRYRASSIPIIALTAYAMKGDRERCLEAGMNDYLSKPIQPEELSRTLDRWLEKSLDERGAAGALPETSTPARSGEAPAVQTADPSKEAPAEAVIFDREGFMKRIMGDESLARRLMSGFLGDMPVQIEKLKAAIVAGDSLLAGQQAHRIKGAAANLGGTALQGVAFSMERAGKAGDLETVRILLPDLQKRFAEFKDALENGNGKPEPEGR